MNEGYVHEKPRKIISTKRCLQLTGVVREVNARVLALVKLTLDGNGNVRPATNKPYKAV